jgi:hypothetical protein
MITKPSRCEVGPPKRVLRRGAVCALALWLSAVGCRRGRSDGGEATASTVPTASAGAIHEADRSSSDAESGGNARPLTPEVTDANALLAADTAPSSTRRKNAVLRCSEAACKAQRGLWGTFGFVPGCAQRASDADKPCVRQSDCEGGCVTELDTPAGARVVGKCYPYAQIPDTSVNFVQDGMAEGPVIIN